MFLYLKLVLKYSCITRTLLQEPTERASAKELIQILEVYK